MERPTLSCDEALRQAGDTAHTYLHRAVRMLDDCFGLGYAERHPQLVAECIRSQTLDFNATAIHAALYALGDTLENVGSEIVQALVELAPKAPLVEQGAPRPVPVRLHPRTRKSRSNVPGPRKGGEDFR